MRCCMRPGTGRRGCPSRWSPSPMRDRPGPPDGPINADVPAGADAPTEAGTPAATAPAPQPDPAARADGPARTGAPVQAGRPGTPGQAGGPAQAGRPEQPGRAGAPAQAGAPEQAGTGSRPPPPPALPPPDVGLRAAIDAIVAGASHDPHKVLGAHPGPGGVVVRALRPLAKTVTVVLPDRRRFPARHLHQGVFAATLPVTEVPAYGTAVPSPGPGGAAGQETITDDPYRHLPTLGEMDTYLIGEGRHEELWRVLGAHVRTFGRTAPADTGPGGARPTPPGETRE